MSCPSTGERLPSPPPLLLSSLLSPGVWMPAPQAPRGPRLDTLPPSPQTQARTVGRSHSHVVLGPASLLQAALIQAGASGLWLLYLPAGCQRHLSEQERWRPHPSPRSCHTYLPGQRERQQAEPRTDYGWAGRPVRTVTPLRRVMWLRLDSRSAGGEAWSAFRDVERGVEGIY